MMTKLVMTVEGTDLNSEGYMMLLLSGPDNQVVRVKTNDPLPVKTQVHVTVVVEKELR